MKIDSRIINYEINRHQSDSTTNINAAQTQPDVNETIEKKTDGQDAIVNISQTSKEVRLAREIIGSTPDIREDKVAELKEKIEYGDYRVNNQAVADKLVDAFLNDIL
jgi:negative regulator of flagellin synthesis FlgM